MTFRKDDDPCMSLEERMMCMLHEALLRMQCTLPSLGGRATWAMDADSWLILGSNARNGDGLVHLEHGLPTHFAGVRIVPVAAGLGASLEVLP